MEIKKLDNPVWYSLMETHQQYAINYNGVQFYHPAYCPFGGFVDINQTTTNIDAYARHINDFYIVGEQALFSNQLILKKEIVCNQMLLNQTIDLEISAPIIELKTSLHKKDLLALINLVQPGYFKNKTPELGTYFDIYKQQQLVAVTGERMKMNAYTEVSAVVCHPAHRGKGYAKQLVTHTTNNIFDKNKLPYLHVAETNHGAVNLYKKLGFSTRRKITFWNIIRNK